jgi:hypothetical protein
MGASGDIYMMAADVFYYRPEFLAVNRNISLLQLPNGLRKGLKVMSNARITDLAK